MVLNVLLAMLSYLLLSLQLGCADTPLRGVWWPAIAVSAWLLYTPRAVSMTATILLGILLEGLARTPAGVQFLSLLPWVWFYHELNHSRETEQAGPGRRLALLSAVLAVAQPATAQLLANLRTGLPTTSGLEWANLAGTTLLTGLLALPVSYLLESLPRFIVPHSDEIHGLN